MFILREGFSFVYRYAPEGFVFRLSDKKKVENAVRVNDKECIE